MSDLEDNDVEDQRITRSMSKRSNSLNNQYDNILDKRIKKLKRSELENIVKYSFSKYIVNDNDIVNEINKSDKNINEIQITNIKQKKKKKKELVNEEDSENIEEISDEDDDYEDNEDNEYEDDDEYEDEDDEYEDEINDYYETIENEIKPNENYFKSLEKEEQLKIIELEKKIQKLQKYDIPIKYQILQSNLDINIKCICMEKLEILQCSESESDEIQKIKIWLETILKIPFGIFKNSAITLNNSLTDINEYIFNIYNKLNESLYGQTAAKCQILQYISQCISNPNCAGNVIGLCGPPGCGKTTLIKHGVSKAIDRPFGFITLGGLRGSNIFHGESPCWIGSKWGNIVDILIQSKCMNPIIYLDELDKVSTASEGKEIVSVLTHITDPSQNTEFHDRYFSNINFDISKCLFIFSYNDESKIDPILKDRIKVIYTKGYSVKEKLVISKKHLIPDILENIGIKREELVFNDDIIRYIIDKTNKEKGVRNLKRSFETIFSKINVVKMNACNLIDLPFKIKDFKLPLTLTNEIVNILLDEKKQDYDSPPNGMYM